MQSDMDGGCSLEGGKERFFENSFKGCLGKMREPTMQSVREGDTVVPRQEQPWSGSAVVEREL